MVAGETKEWGRSSCFTNPVPSMEFLDIFGLFTDPWWPTNGWCFFRVFHVSKFAKLSMGSCLGIEWFQVPNPFLSFRWCFSPCNPIFSSPNKQWSPAAKPCLRFSGGRKPSLLEAPWSQEILIKAFYEKHLEITKKKHNPTGFLLINPGP